MKGGWGAAPNNSVQPRKIPNTQADTCLAHSLPNLANASQTADRIPSPRSEMRVARKDGVRECGSCREQCPGAGRTGSKERQHRTPRDSRGQQGDSKGQQGTARPEDLGMQSSPECVFLQGLVGGQLSTPRNRCDHFFSSPCTNAKKNGIDFQPAT